MKTAVVCLGLLALVGSSTASLDAFNSVKESQELEHTGGQQKSLSIAISNVFFRERAGLCGLQLIGWLLAAACPVLLLLVVHWTVAGLPCRSVRSPADICAVWLLRPWAHLVVEWHLVP